MGILHFETVVERIMEGECCPIVNLGDLADQYRARTGKRPVMVIDGSNLVHYYYFYDRQRDFLCGGQLREFMEFTRFFLHKLQELQIEPVFYFDGPTAEAKINCRKERNIFKFKKLSKVFNSVGRVPYTELSKFSMMPVLISVAWRYFLKFECNCKVLVSVRDCDVELAAYANRESCFAILSQDTDFLCMKNAMYYLSVKHLDLNYMTTMVYDRCSVLNYYSLNTQQMWLFASLMGNDVISEKRLKKFHDSLSVGSCAELCKNVADFVNAESKDYCNNIEKSVPAIINRLNSLDLNIGEAELRASLRSYQPSEMESWVKDNNMDDPWIQVLEMAYSRHVACETIPDVYNTLLGHPYEIGLFLESSGRDHQSSSRVFFLLRQKIYSLLLHEKPWGNAPHQVKEFGHWDKVWHDFEGVEVPVLEEGLIHPGLIALWTRDSPRINQQRWILFANAISPSLDPTVLMELNYHYVVPVAVLHYLKNINYSLTEKEVESFIKQAVTVSYLNPTVSLANNCPTKRMINVSTLLGYGISIVLFLMSVLGFPLQKAMPWHYFEGPLFHYFLLIEDQGRMAHNVYFDFADQKVQNRIKEDVDIIRAIIGSRRDSGCYTS